MRCNAVPIPPKSPLPSRCSGFLTRLSCGSLGRLQTASRGPNSSRLLQTGVCQFLRTPIPASHLLESGAVINYLLRIYDKQNMLRPHAGSEQAHVDFDKWTFFLVSSLGPMQGQANWFTHSHTPFSFSSFHSKCQS
jgi:hypothetical protein